MAEVAFLPWRFPEVAHNFTGSCLIEVYPGRRSGRGRFWLPKGGGYTDVISRAGVYPADRAHRIGACSETAYPIDALAALELEHARLVALAENTREMIEAVRASIPEK